MKKIAIIGANEFQNPLILKAKEMGYETHVFAWKDGSIGEKSADYFYPISIRDKEEVLEKCKEIGIDAITSIGSDLTMITVTYVAENMGLISNTHECVKNSTNKYEMRKKFKESNVAIPMFTELESSSENEKIKNMKYPLIVKPTDRSGSRGITKVNNEDELKKAIENGIENSFEKKAIIEEYIEGEEYSCECISYEGKHQFLAITKKYTTNAPHFIETGHIEPAGFTKEQEKNIVNEIFKALDALDIKYGASHSEFKITPNGDLRIIEIGARMGGDCIGSDLVKISTGYDFVKMVVDVAFGKKPILEKVCKPKIAVIKFILKEEDIKMLEKIKEEAPETITFVSKIEDINSHKVVDSSSRYGFFILACKSIEEVRRLVNF